MTHAEYEAFLRELKQRSLYNASYDALWRVEKPSEFADALDMFATWIADETKAFCNNGKRS